MGADMSVTLEIDQPDISLSAEKDGIAVQDIDVDWTGRLGQAEEVLITFTGADGSEVSVTLDREEAKRLATELCAVLGWTPSKADLAAARLDLEV